MEWRYYVWRTLGGSDAAVVRRSLSGLSQRWDPEIADWVPIPGESLGRAILDGDVLLDQVSRVEALRRTADRARAGP